MRIAVCLPTYDERENVTRMVHALGAVFAANGIDGDVLVIDDASPDGTGQVAEALTREFPYLSVLHRPRKAGIGPAYRAGFRWALERGADVVVEMDCDFSHDPADVPRLIAAAEAADVVIGSRYVAGGGIRSWGLLRRSISRAGSLYARALLGLPVRDPTSGFKCFRRHVLETIGIDSVTSIGYAFQIETTYRSLRAGFRVVEVPIVFTDRERGGSKMSRAIVLEAVVRVPALRLAAARGRL